MLSEQKSKVSRYVWAAGRWVEIETATNLHIHRWRRPKEAKGVELDLSHSEAWRDYFMENSMQRRRTEMSFSFFKSMPEEELRKAKVESLILSKEVALNTIARTT